ncbi:MAG: hypothetical protein ACRDLL_08280 [Solirubrobacterales bacterium]
MNRRSRSWLGATSSSRTAREARCAATAVALIALGLVVAPAARASLQPIGLSVDGGEGNWHPAPAFALRWTNPAGTATVHYRLLDPGGEPVFAEKTLNWPATSIQPLTVPPPSGVYTAEVWLEDGGGSSGPPAAAKLRFDDTAPGRVEPAPVAKWIGRTAFPYTVQLNHPTEPPPPSGIRGYAVSVDLDASGKPCAGAICGEDEIDLREGAADDRVAIGELPEGIRFLHAVAVSGSGIGSAIPGSVVLRVDKTDPVTRLDGVPSGWSRQPLTLTATATDEASGMAPGGGGPAPFTAIRIDGAAPVRGGGDAISTTVTGSGVHTVAYYARDAAGNVADGGSANGQPDHAPSTARVRIDGDPPQLAFTGSQDPIDPERIEARAADALSGLDRARGEIAVRPVGSGERFSALPTQISGGAMRARWDSEAYPPGGYEFRAIAYDLAGNSAATASHAGGAPMRLRAPLKAETKLLADFTQRALQYGRVTRFGGRLVAGRRAPLPDAAVRIVESFDAGALTRERISTVRTDARGAFEVRLDPGPSRKIVVIAPATATARSAASDPLRLAVSGDVSLRVSAAVARVGGRPVIFAGRVGSAGARIPAGGKLIELQFRLPGLPWREFRTLRADRRGRFRYAYRFADDDSRGVRFQFRAFAPAQAGWPFEPAGSRPVTVTGA